MPRIHWHDLPAATRAAVAVHTGVVHTARSARTGINSGIAATIDTDRGRFFVKGVPAAHPQALTQQREADINPHLPPGCPRLLWRARTAEWDLLGFELITGRTADFAPGSPDLPRVVAALDQLARTPCPDLPLKRVAQRWAPYAATGAVGLLDGDQLLHTDMAPHNVLIGTDSDPSAHLIDWAWPSRGPAWVDAAVWVLRLLEAGHTPEQADRWARQLAPWRAAPTAGVRAFADANAALWAELGTQDPERGWKTALAGHARAWAAYIHGERSADGVQTGVRRGGSTEGPCSV